MKENNNQVAEKRECENCGATHGTVITLTGSHIKEIAEFAGFEVADMTGDENHLEIEYDVYEYPNTRMLDDDGNVSMFEFSICVSEYPEEGYLPIGVEIL